MPSGFAVLGDPQFLAGHGALRADPEVPRPEALEGAGHLRDPGPSW
ncbi:hypothetical protein [Deinococcus hopiensis]|nr:hypothetical protein [Deinococcus hopiensis]